MTDISRRRMLTTLGVAGASIVPSGLMEAAAEVSKARPQATYLFLNSEEAAFIEAAVDRLIPADEKWGGAVEELHR